MEKIARSIEDARELVNAMLNGGMCINGEWFDENCGDAYLDWGAIDDGFQNVSCKYFAEEVAREFQMKGYFVYVQVMGYGCSYIPEGTPVCIRIKTNKPLYHSKTLIPFC